MGCPALCVPPHAMVALMYFILLAGIMKDGFCPKTGSISHPWGQAKSPAPALLEQARPGLDKGGRHLSHSSLQDDFLCQTPDKLVIISPEG